jgi:hypothetical protein
MRRLAVLMMVLTVVAATASVAGAKPPPGKGKVDTSYKECVFELEGNGTSWVKTAPDDDTCIFIPTKLVRADGTHPTAADAHWTFTVDLDAKGPTWVLFTMRDGIPGNWCKVPNPYPPESGYYYYTDGPPDGYYDDGNDATLEWDPEDTGGRNRWMPGDFPITRDFYFPPGEFGSVPNELTGVCLNLGAGGDMFGVGDTESFYLVAPGQVTVQQRVDFP